MSNAINCIPSRALFESRKYESVFSMCLFLCVSACVCVCARTSVQELESIKQQIGALIQLNSVHERPLTNSLKAISQS